MLQFLIEPNSGQRRFGQLILFCTFVLISFFVFSKPSYSQSISHIDKVGHFGAFFLLGFLLQLATNWRVSLQFAVLTMYAASIELIQSQLPYRRADPADFIADLLGALSFYCILLMLRRWEQA